jgi:bifunctional DNA-binding transcriptional regulator/antitoxin component of YhaV-PrlF toxin-antitoxin module
MIVELSEQEKFDVDRGVPVVGTVTGSEVECVLVRADLFERVRYLLDSDPDSGINEMAGLLADTSPEDWKPAEEWRGERP